MSLNPDSYTVDTSPQKILASLPSREVERTARQMNLPGFGAEQQARLHRASVLIVGAGGLGCPAIQQLAAAGVGSLTIIDDDTVDITNIHRQILFGADDVGKPKAPLAAERARALQPDINLEVLQKRLTAENCVDIVSSVDLVLDGSDTFATKYLVADAAEITGTPLVWGTVLRFAGEVALWHSGPVDSTHRGVGLRDLFPEQPDGDSVPDCATAGVLGVTTSVVAGLMSTEAISYLAGLRTTPGRLSSYDALAAKLSTFQVSADPARGLVTDMSHYDSVDVSADEPSDDSGESISVSAQRLRDEIRAGHAIALDVREPHEYYLADLPHEPAPPRRLPMSQLAEAPDPQTLVAEAVEDADHVVVFCASGVRSQRFVDDYADSFPHVNVRSLPGGVQ